MTETNTILKTTDLCIGFPGKKNNGSVIYKNINIQAGKKELVALLGANGIGKSTLLRSLVKLQDPVRGEISLFDQDIRSLTRTQMARKVGFVSTEVIQVNNLSVFDLVALGRYPHTSWTGRLTGHDRDKVEEAISMVGIASKRNRYINRLSDGERQRVMIARTLAQDTELIVLDEPTAFLDLPNKYEIVHLLHKLANERGKTIIFSTHDLNIAIQESDRLWLMLDDSILQGAPEDLILSGSFGKLFGESNLKFNSEKGEFRIAREHSCDINLQGPETEYFWTRNALNRSGFRVTDHKEEKLAIKIEKDRGTIIWNLTDGPDSFSFNSVYDMCLFLGKKLHHPAQT
jgi:iron complex transport system ATP-binding protein